MAAGIFMCRCISAIGQRTVRSFIVLLAAASFCLPIRMLAGTQFGSKPWVVLLVRFADSPSVTPHPRDWYQSLIGTNYPGLDHYWRELSYGNVDLSGSLVAGWYNLPQSRSYYLDGTGSLNFDRAIQDATAVADADVNFSTISGIIIMFNQPVNGYAGFNYASVPFTRDGITLPWGAAVIPSDVQSQSVIAHEMGHGFGFDHSTQWDVMGGGQNTNPPVLLYGAVASHCNAYHKDILGWIPGDRKVVVLPGTNQTVALERLASPATTNALVVYVPISSSGAASLFYTIEARRPAGYDVGSLPDDSVIIHRVDATLSDYSSRAVDGSGGIDLNGIGKPLRVGENFNDIARGVTVRVVSSTGSGFVVSVTNASAYPIGDLVTNLADSGLGSFRNAIEWANRYPHTRIRFNLPSQLATNGIFTIAPLTSLPPIQGYDTLIDGASQPGFQGVPLIELAGYRTSGGSGLWFNDSTQCRVRNLIINRFIDEGVVIYGGHAISNRVESCYIGTASSGNSRASNSFGVFVFGGANRNVIGGVGVGNVISGNRYHGVTFRDSGTCSNIVQGNYIGTASDATTGVPNGIYGVFSFLGASSNLIGGFSLGEGNVIAKNLSAGVAISNPQSVGNTAVGNSIFGNGSSAIALDDGGNHLQIAPTMSNAVVSANLTTLRGTLSSTANRAYRVDCYASHTATAVSDSTYLGGLIVFTANNGKADFGFAVAGALTNLWVSATATDLGGDTSQFSSSVPTVIGVNNSIRPSLSGIWPNNSNLFMVRVNIEPNHNYRLQTSTNFLSWEDLTNFSSSAPTIDLLDSKTTNYPRKFYRVVYP